jgi:hypothetical protein
MFTRHAIFRNRELGGFALKGLELKGLELKGPGFKGSRPWRMVPRGSESVHANDSLRDIHRPASQHRPLPPKLACHWVLTDRNRLECRWRIEDPDGNNADEPDGPGRARSRSGLSPSAQDFTPRSSNCLIRNALAGAVRSMAGSGPPKASGSRVGISP